MGGVGGGLEGGPGGSGGGEGGEGGSGGGGLGGGGGGEGGRGGGGRGQGGNGGASTDGGGMGMGGGGERVVHRVVHACEARVASQLATATTSFSIACKQSGDSLARLISRSTGSYLKKSAVLGSQNGEATVVRLLERSVLLMMHCTPLLSSLCT